MTTIRWGYIILAAYLPFESYIAAWLIGTETGILLAKQVSDGLVILSFLVFFISRFAQGNFRISDICSGCLLLIAFFTMFAILTTALNGGDILVALLQVKAVARYILVGYVIANIGFTEAQWRWFLSFFTCAAMLNIGLALTQIFLPGLAAALNPYGFIGQDQSRVLVSTSQLENATGTFAFGAALNTIEFAFLLVAWWIMFNSATGRNGNRRRKLSLVSFVGICVLVFFSGSKIAFLALVILGLLHFTSVLSGRSLLFFKLFSVSLFIIGLIPLLASFGVIDLSETEFFSFLSTDYIEIAKLQRLGIIFTYFEIFSNFSWAFLFGLGSDPVRVVELLVSQNYSVPYLLTFSPNSVEDVFWISIFVFYGVFGGMALLLVLGRLFFLSSAMARKSQSVELVRINTAVSSFLVFIFLTGFLNQVLEVKQFSFYFWALAGYSRFLRGHYSSPHLVSQLRETRPAEQSKS